MHATSRDTRVDQAIGLATEAQRLLNELADEITPSDGADLLRAHLSIGHAKVLIRGWNHA